jgi:hypothetical protein
MKDEMTRGDGSGCPVTDSDLGLEIPAINTYIQRSDAHIFEILQHHVSLLGNDTSR